MNRHYAQVTTSAVAIRLPSSTLPFLAGALGAAFMFAFGTYWLSAIGLGAFTYFFVRLLLEAGHDVPIESFILTMASLQWIVGPVLAYAGFTNHYKYYMYVPVETYMALAVPALVALGLGLYTFRSRHRPKWVYEYAAVTRKIVGRAHFLPFYLIGIGFIFSFLVDRFPPALAFPAFVLSNIKYIGLIYLLFSPVHKHKLAIVSAAFLLTFLSSLKGAMFHDLLLWSAFIGMYVALIFRPGFSKKLLLAIAGLMFIFVLQASKDLYREKLEEQGRAGYVQKFLSSVDERLGSDDLSRSSNIERVVVRINQGWIISKIMQTVPARVPHADGATVETAIKSSLLPRFLYPDKPKAGGRENYEKYTGYILQSSTSMGISLLGEAYINYGVTGAWLFMFIFGLLSSFVIKQFFVLASKYSTIWLWFPLILLHFVKAETELLVQLNFLVKSIILVYLFVWANKHILRLKL